MLLPPPLFEALASHVGHHICWHAARQPGQDELRAKFCGECDRAGLRALDEAGCGCDFLHFHRRMMRHFGWLLARTPVASFRFVPWKGRQLPRWVESVLRTHDPAFDLDAAYSGILARISGDHVDELGTFIEPSNRYRGGETPGAGLHMKLHAALGEFETSLYSGDDTAPMTSIGRSPGNIFFWTLHGWIDDRYAEWQVAHGDKPDRSPLKMHDSHVHCDE